MRHLFSSLKDPRAAGVWLLFAGFSLITLWLAGHVVESDVAEYHRYALQALSPPLGQHWPREYPALSLSVFLLPLLLPCPYRISFAVLTLAALAGLIQYGMTRHGTRWALTLLGYLTLGTIGLFGQRYDIFPALAAFIALDQARQQYADELARVKAQGPVERIVEKVVEKPVSDPAQAALQAKLEADLQAAQQKIESLLQSGYAQADLTRIETEKKVAEKRLEAIQRAMAHIAAPDGQVDQIRLYRTAIAQFVEEAHKRLKPVFGDWQRVGASDPFAVNWMLYQDIQRLADSLDTVASGLRRIPLDAGAAKKHGRDGTIIDVTARTKGEDIDGGNPDPQLAP